MSVKLTGFQMLDLDGEGVKEFKAANVLPLTLLSSVDQERFLFRRAEIRGHSRL